jgi:hypothetical protein
MFWFLLGKNKSREQEEREIYILSGVRTLLNFGFFPFPALFSRRFGVNGRTGLQYYLSTENIYLELKRTEQISSGTTNPRRGCLYPA